MDINEKAQHPVVLTVRFKTNAGAQFQAAELLITDTLLVCTILSKTHWAEMPQAVAVSEGSLLSLPGCSALQFPTKTLQSELSSVCSCPREPSWSPHTSQGKCAAAMGSAKNASSLSSLRFQTGLHFSSKSKWP